MTDDELRSSAECGGEQCLLLIPVASDELVHDTFKALALRWCSQLRQETLQLEGGLNVTPGFATPTPGHVRRLLDADCWIIRQAGVQVADLLVSYWRASGHGGFKTSLLDELRIEVRDGCDFPAEAAADVLAFMCERLHAMCACATQRFADLANQMRDDLTVAAMPSIPERHAGG